MGCLIPAASASYTAFEHMPWDGGRLTYYLLFSFLSPLSVTLWRLFSLISGESAPTHSAQVLLPIGSFSVRGRQGLTVLSLPLKVIHLETSAYIYTHSVWDGDFIYFIHASGG